MFFFSKCQLKAAIWSSFLFFSLFSFCTKGPGLPGSRRIVGRPGTTKPTESFPKSFHGEINFLQWQNSFWHRMPFFFSSCSFGSSGERRADTIPHQVGQFLGPGQAKYWDGDQGANFQNRSTEKSTFFDENWFQHRTRGGLIPWPVKPVDLLGPGQAECRVKDRRSGGGGGGGEDGVTGGRCAPFRGGTRGRGCGRGRCRA